MPNLPSCRRLASTHRDDAGIHLESGGMAS